jgi:hypothetical protein
MRVGENRSDPVCDMIHLREVVMVVIIGNGEKFGQFIIDKTDLS